MNTIPKLSLSFPKLLPGDLMGIYGGPIAKYLTSKIFTPSTILFHFLITGDHIPKENDYEILESINSGVRTGRISWYYNDLYVIFRKVDVSIIDREDSFRMASQFGRWGYDFLAYPLIFWDSMKALTKMIFKEHKLRKLNQSDIPDHENHAFICTEFVNACWNQVGKPIIPIQYTPIPCGYIEALEKGILKLVWINIPKSFKIDTLSKVIPSKFLSKEYWV